MNLCILWAFIKQVYHAARSTECENVTHYTVFPRKTFSKTSNIYRFKTCFFCGFSDSGIADKGNVDLYHRPLQVALIHDLVLRNLQERWTEQ
jgi:hypothetical protein